MSTGWKKYYDFSTELRASTKNFSKWREVSNSVPLRVTFPHETKILQH